jgi:hypothetical protein
MAVTMIDAVVWDGTSCGSCKNRRFGENYRLHHQDDKNQRARNNVSSNWQTKKPLQRNARATRRNILKDGILQKHADIAAYISVGIISEM